MLDHYGVKPALQPSWQTIRGQSPDSSSAGSEGLRVASATSNLKNLAIGASSGIQAGSADVSQRSLNATVRLKVVDDGGHSFGTGTVIDVHGTEALVLTCGHIFRTSEGKGRIQIDRFDQPGSESLEGSLIDYDMDLDIALVSVKVEEPIAVARLAPINYRAKPGEAVFSVGCGRGAPPTVMQGKVNQIDKYLGPPNITVSGQPVDGRSGGGLFNQRGELIGVCSAADPEFDEGLYGALPRVYYELDRNGLSFVYGNAKPGAVASSLDAGSTDNSPNAVGVPSMVPARPDGGSNGINMPNGLGSVESPVRNKDELVCVLRSNGTDEARVFVIDNPSTVLLEYLQREAKSSEAVATDVDDRNLLVK